MRSWVLWPRLNRLSGAGVGLAAAMLVTAIAPSAALGQNAPGYVVEVYATVTDPCGLAFDAAGVLYVGRDLSGSGGDSAAPCRIHRVGIGGSPVEEFGAEIEDPDGVIVDITGSVTGTPGAVIVAHSTASTGTGELHVIRPDGSTYLFLGPTPIFVNPWLMAIDQAGNLLVADDARYTQHIVRVVGGQANEFIARPGGFVDVAVDADGRVYTTSSDKVVRIYSAGGALVNDHFAEGVSNIDFARSGPFGLDLYGVSSSGELYRFDSAGDATLVCSGLGNNDDLAFGPDGSLYVSDFANDRILRIRRECQLPGQPALWLRADGLPSWTPGQAVEAWLDQSGNSLDVSQADPAMQPLFQPNVINGRPALWFDGNDSLVRADVLGSSLSQPDAITIYLVMSQSSVDSQNSAMGWGWREYDPELDNNRLLVHAAYGGWLMLQHGDVHAEGYGGWQPAGWPDQFHVVELQRAGDIFRGALDGTDLGAQDRVGAPPLLTDQVHPLYIGSDQWFNYLTGYIAEALVYSRALSPAERWQVARYVKSKYGLGRLPGDFNNDGQVDAADVMLFNAKFSGPCVPRAADAADADFDGDGDVDQDDFGILQRYFTGPGQSCLPG